MYVYIIVLSHNYYVIVFMQILNTWHLLCIVGGICCMGVLLILAKTIAQALTTPELVTDSEEPLGTKVCMYIHVCIVVRKYHVCTTFFK